MRLLEQEFYDYKTADVNGIPFQASSSAEINDTDKITIRMKATALFY